MSEIKCSCGLGACTNRLKLSAADGGVWVFHCKSPSELLMHLDANAAVNLIKELRSYILSLTEVSQ